MTGASPGRSVRRRAHPPSALLRALATTLAILLGAVIPVATASAATSGPVTVSGVAISGGQVSGVATVQGRLDGGTSGLTAVLGTKTLALTTTAVAPSTRGMFLVVDTSQVTGAAGLTAVKAAVASYLAVLPDDVLVGLIGYSGTAKVVVKLGTDRGALTSGLNALTLGTGRATYDALAVAQDQLGPAGNRSILLVTSGGDARSQATEQQVASALTTAKIPVLAVGYGPSAASATQLGQLAKDTGGTAIAAADSAALTSAFTTVGRRFTTQLRFRAQAPVDEFGSQQLVVSGASAGTAFVSTQALDLGAAPSAANAPAAPVPAAPTTVAFGFPLPVLLGLLAIAAGLVAIVGAVAAPAFASRGRLRALEIGRLFESRVAPVRQATPTALTQNLISFGDRVMKDRESTTKTMALIQRADLPLRAGEWWVLRIVSVVVVAVVGGFVLHGLGVGGVVIGILGGVLLPPVVLRRLAARRSAAFEQQLPDVLVLVASGLSTGFSLLQAMDSVARDAAQPAAKEFSRTMAETRIGADVDEALSRMAVRMESRSMELTAMAVRIQRQVGGNLSETLSTTATTLRDRELLDRHVRALSADGRLSSYILVALPFLVFLVVLYANHAYVEVLWTTTLGIVMLVYGLVSMAVGIFVMRQVTRVEV